MGSGNQREATVPIYPYSVFLLLPRLTYKLSREAGNGEVTNPKYLVRERDRNSLTVLHELHVELRGRGILHLDTATEQFAELTELDKYLARLSNFRRYRWLVYCLIGQRRFNLSPLLLDSTRAARLKTRN